MATISLKAIARDMRWAWRTRLAVDAMKANGMAIPSVCIPQREKVTTEQVRDVVVKDLAAHPETGHQTAAGHALLRLQAAFPCK